MIEIESMFVPATVTERIGLLDALDANVQGKAMIMDRSTSFVGTGEVVEDEEVINAIRAVPVHY